MNPRVTLSIALAIIRHPDRECYLIALRRSDVHLPDVWEFPGGKCMPGEEPAACAVREAREETGLEVCVQETWPAITFDYAERTVILHPFLCQATASAAQPLESRAVHWAAPDELTHYPFPEANAALIQRLQASSQAGSDPA